MPNANDKAGRTAAGHGDGSDPRRLWIGRGLAVLGGLGLLAWLLASAVVPCGFARAFHAPCPGCGSTRAMRALAHGDLAGLLRFNPFAPIMSVLVLAFALDVVASVVTTGTLVRVGSGRSGRLVTRGVVVVAALEVVFWLLRFAGMFGGPVPV